MALVVGITAILVVLFSVPVVSATQSYGTSDPCTNGFSVGAQCYGHVSFQSNWNSQVKVSWHLNGTAGPVGGSAACMGPGLWAAASLSSNGNFSFSSAGGTTQCVFSGGTYFQVTVSLLSPIL